MYQDKVMMVALDEDRYQAKNEKRAHLAYYFVISVHLPAKAYRPDEAPLAFDRLIAEPK